MEDCRKVWGTLRSTSTTVVINAIKQTTPSSLDPSFSIKLKFKNSQNGTTMNNHDHPLFSKVCNIMDLFNLTQVVTDCTHTSPNGNSSLIDLVLISSPPQSLSCTTIPPLANSDHDGLRLTISHKGGTQCSNTKNSLYCEDIDQHSTQWQDMYMSIMEQCIPTKVLPPKRRNRPWINKSISQCIRRRNAAFKRAKNINSPRIWMHYKHIRNRVTSQLQLAKKKFFNNLNLSNPKSFWKSTGLGRTGHICRYSEPQWKPMCNR